MKVFKFGGASVKNAEAVKNLFEIVNFETENMLIIVSAMGKTTNLLENLHQLAFNKKDYSTEFEILKKNHLNIITSLFEDKIESIEKLFSELETLLNECSNYSKAFSYAQIVAYGELLSTKIISNYFDHKNKIHSWIDARKYIQTDNHWLEANVNWSKTNTLISELTTKKSLIITQGFIGSSKEGHTTTLGREGSDFSAAIFAHCLNATSLTVWKDVDGILTGDPKKFDNVQKFDQLSYRETIEMAFYGATVIHPKTIKPLAEKKIPLFVRSFLNLEKEGTKIVETTNIEPYPSFILKENQSLITFSSNDLSFTDENSLVNILSFFDNENIKINLIQSSATSLSICIDYSQNKINLLMGTFSNKYVIHYNTDLKLLTVKNYNETALNKMDFGSKNIYLEQKTRRNLRLLYK